MVLAAIAHTVVSAAMAVSMIVWLVEMEQLRGIAAEAELQRQLDARERRLALAERMESVGRLAGGVAHDFNNLLTVVKGNSALLLPHLPVSSPGREWLMEIDQATDRGAGLIRQLLAFGESVGFEWRPAVGPAWVRVDPSRIEQVIVNLVTNARDAMPNGGRCAIATVTEPTGSGGAGVVRLTVTDTGVGMSDEVQARVFEPFFTTKPPGFGTGLGLATTYGVVEQAGGHVTVASRLQVGTTFTVTLPVAEPAGEPAGIPAVVDATGAPAGGSELVVVVEDEPRVRRVASRTLARHGYRVVEAADGVEALDLLAHTPGVACIVSDVVMPRLGGDELARRLQDRYPSIPVVFTSGYAGDFAPPATGTTAFLQKPYTPDDLAATVRRLIDRARSP